ncbi:MAG: hypothetical protein ABIV28_08875, partial [Longimicrobiales bacterium]
MKKFFAKGATALAILALLTACSEPTSTDLTSTEGLSQSAAPMASAVTAASFTSVTSPAPGTIVATFGEAGASKSYNVKLSPGGGVHHVPAAQLVNGLGSTSWEGLDAGTYELCIKVEGVGGPFGNCRTISVEAPAVVLTAQTIAFGPLGDRTYGAGTFTVSATGGGSGNPVTFSAEGDCTVSGNVVTITGAGSCTITASQNGSATHSAA